MSADTGKPGEDGLIWLEPGRKDLRGRYRAGQKAGVTADTGKHPPIHVTTDGDTLWLYCFADDPDAERGEIIRSVEPGDSWWDLAAAVDRHIVEHGC